MTYLIFKHHNSTTNIYISHHLHCIKDVPIAVDHDSHRHKETGQEEQEDEGCIVWVLRCPVQRAAQLVDFQSVAVPPQQRSSSPGEGVEPNVGDGPPCPGEVHDLGVDHTDVALIGQRCQSHNGNNAWQRRETDSHSE